MFAINNYHGTIRKSIALFGSLFNDIVISREDAEGVRVQAFKVPISYGPREKFLARIESDPNLDRAQAISLPRISFELKSINYATDRKLASSQKRAFSTANNSIYNVVYADVPYDLSFSLSVLCKESEDGAKIIEQILPYFTPEHVLSVKMIDQFPDMIVDIPIILNRVTSEDRYTGPFTERRVLSWDLDFTMRVKLYGPVFKKKIIKIASVNSYPNLDNNTILSSVSVRPGLTANGTPTTYVNNSISAIDIAEDDNYGYIITVENFPDV
jgi:hypothetical protein